ncbi:hypothetical protein DCAR_0310832 [Daucus carota subsp. sativus]|uniref:Uncharacterized protein n=1 Tax=Daucus carota subsp. sativus TaxID=79200 RepID=A0A161XWD2_DAUCS|nr:hypothetical protein DCAR_0310832 [Daucus carota subsp. sativus]
MAGIYFEAIKAILNVVLRSFPHSGAGAEEQAFNIVGAFFNKTYKNGRDTPLHLAARKDNPIAVKWIAMLDPQYITGEEDDVYGGAVTKNRELSVLIYELAESRESSSVVVQQLCMLYELDNILGHFGQVALRAAIMMHDERGRSTGDFSNFSTATTSAAAKAHRSGFQTSKKQQRTWEEVIYISTKEFEAIKEEALRLKDIILEDGMTAALVNNNFNIIRYAKNRIEIVKRCVDAETITKAIEGNIEAQEKALEKIMLCNWEGPIIRFSDKEMQDRLEKGEVEHRDFILRCEEWVDENVLNMVKDGCEEVVENDEENGNLADNSVNDSAIDESINTGDLHVIDEGLQSSVCNLIQKIKLCRKKKQNKKVFKGNPFDIGRCKFSKINKNNRKNAHRALPATSKAEKGNDALEKEAAEIIQMAEAMGLKLKKSKEETIKEIKEQLRNSVI